MEMLADYDPTSYRAPRLNLTTLRGVNAFGLMSSAIAAFMSANAGQSPLVAVALGDGDAFNAQREKPLRLPQRARSRGARRVERPEQRTGAIARVA